MRRKPEVKNIEWQKDPVSGSVTAIIPINLGVYNHLVLQQKTFPVVDEDGLVLTTIDSHAYKVDDGGSLIYSDKVPLVLH